MMLLLLVWARLVFCWLGVLLLLVCRWCWLSGICLVVFVLILVVC